MIHCICNNINTKAVEAAAAKGAETAACVQRACGSRFRCGQCRTDIEQHLRSWRQTRPMLDAAE
ncbi:(2Fe-2S)-binding protein [Algimonas arctica]|uniref:(2Fe-2S)-binding protein n=1 Tax=Algimonas arctica TaxID=1479486 RepID=UPI00167B3EB6|nr:(2Fe-2S)-binding protein [Algimonas arctica]